MMGPTTSLIVYLSEKERIKCLKGSKVKQYGNDVVGSYKILLCTYLMPLTCAIHSTLVYFLLKKFTKIAKNNILKIKGIPSKKGRQSVIDWLRFSALFFSNLLSKTINIPNYKAQNN